ncbi:MAG: hypothetical protein LBL74_02085 [Bacteroidales bacterium]|jgi:hypothetical protein|nr:hypothetical protein [Bacteroidales bacterium]
MTSIILIILAIGAIEWLCSGKIGIVLIYILLSPIYLAGFIWGIITYRKDWDSDDASDKRLNSSK